MRGEGVARERGEVKNDRGRERERWDGKIETETYRQTQTDRQTESMCL